MQLIVHELFGGISAVRHSLETTFPGKFLFEEYVELSPKAVKLHNDLYGDKAKRQDVRKWKPKDKCNLLWYSAPCQDISISGKQQGAEEGSGTRSSLMWAVADRLENDYPYMPQLVIGEQVPNILRKPHRQALDKWIAKLDQLGYRTVIVKLNALDCGVPQNRTRVFIVSFDKNFAKSFNVDAFASHIFEPVPMRPLTEFLDPEVNPLDLVPDTANHIVKNVESGRIHLLDPEVDHTRTVQTVQYNKNCAGLFLVPIKEYTNFVIHPRMSTGRLDNGNYNRVWKLDKYVGSITVKANIKVLWPVKEPIPGKMLCEYNGQLCHIKYLSPAECLNLQGFGREMYEKVKHHSPYSLRKAAGNSICVPMLNVLFKELFNEKYHR